MADIHLNPETSLLVSAGDSSNAIIRRLSNNAGGTRLSNALYNNININSNCVVEIGPFSESRRYKIDNQVGDISYSYAPTKLNYNNLSTGIYAGGQISINIEDNTKFDIAAGKGTILDNYTDPENPSVYRVEWSTFTAQIPSYIATDFTSYVALDAGGNLVQFSGAIDANNRRDYIVLGLLIHTGNLFLENVSNFPSIGYDAVNTLNDLASALGLINISGNVYDANAADLKIAKDAGQSFRIGNNFSNSVKSPNITNDSSLSAPYLFKPYRADAAGSGFLIDFPLTQNIDPNNYDDGSGVLADAANKWQIQRIYYDSAGEDTIVAYGQNVYNTSSGALDNIHTESFIKNPVLKDALLRGFLVIRAGCTDLSDTSLARFYAADKLGQVPAEGSQLSVPAGFLNTSTALKSTGFTINLNKSYRIDNSANAVTGTFVSTSEDDVGKACECWIISSAATHNVVFQAPNDTDTINGVTGTVGNPPFATASSANGSYRRVKVRIIDAGVYLIDNIDSVST